MFSKIINNSVQYVQIWEHRVKISDKKRGVIFDEEASLVIKTNNKGQDVVVCAGDAVKAYASDNKFSVIKPFSHPRSLISNFVVAEQFLQYAVKMSRSGNFIAITPLLIIHPMEKLEGGITEVEKRAFQELALGAGARECIVHKGDEINLCEYNFKAEKEGTKINDSSIAHKVFVFTTILLVSAIMFSPIIFDLIS